MAANLVKVAELLLTPLGLGLVILGVGLLLAGLGRRRLGPTIAVLATAGLWTAATPFVSQRLMARLESLYPLPAIDSIPAADAIVILGGGLANEAALPSNLPNLGSAADRLFVGWTLFRAGKAPLIVLSGGIAPLSAATTPEADIARPVLLAFGARPENIIVETKSRTTHENAVEVAAIARERHWQSLILVTSAVHMPRALAAFRKEGLTVDPAAADARAKRRAGNGAFALFPEADALAETTAATKELLGLAFYRLMGWA